MAIVLFTDFGAEGPYLGQMEAVLDELAPDCKVINLLSNAPTANPLLSSYLLAALSDHFANGTIFLSVVDPGVGGERKPVVLEADGRFFVGPENSLFNTVAISASTAKWSEIIWRPEHCSHSFHGRDIFAPVAAKLATHTIEGCLSALEVDLTGWAEDLFKIIYIDHYGNAMTGIRFKQQYQGMMIRLGDKDIQQAGTFCEVDECQLFWYVNSCGLIEIAANRTSAQALLSLQLGDDVQICNVL